MKSLDHSTGTVESRAWFCGLLLVAILLAWVALPDAANGSEVSDDVCVMTYNLRYANENPGEAWSSRRALLTECIRAVGPDIMGTQEGLYPQLRDIATDLPDLDWIGLGRQGGSRDEFTAVFFRRARLEPLEFDHFWLSDTPDVIGSATWGNTYRRMVTWVHFRDKQTHQEFFVWNTHLDHQVQEARVKSAALIRERIGRIDRNMPVLLIGDFNADAATNDVHRMLVDDGGLTDMWSAAAARRGGERGTFNGFGDFSLGFVRIDWILARGDVQADSAEVVEFTKDGRFPSDHFPVVAHLRIGAHAAHP